MTTSRFILALSVALLLTLPVATPQETTETTVDKTSEKKDEEKGKLEEKKSVTKHSVTIDGQELSYTATAGTLVLTEEDGADRASVFYIAYTRDGVDDPTKRPITFTFNGGPGSSSVWLHMGAFGPRRVKMDPEGNSLPPPYELVNNEYSLLDLTDLVFIDPVSTGYSRAAKKADVKQFHGVKEDIESVGEFIRLYATRNERWGSPKFVAGESYGTTRAAGLSGYLQSRHGMYLNGIVLVSSILNFGTARFDRGNDLPFILFLPSYTATAWYHKKLPADLQSKPVSGAVEQAREFARTDYTVALMQGDKIDPSTRNRIADQLSRLTGLSRDYVERTNLRIHIHRFAKELLRTEGFTVGRFDSRLKGEDYDDAGERFDSDPSYAVIQGTYSTLFKDYVRRALKFESDLPYEILTGRVRPWNYGEYENQYVNVAETLREAITQNPSLKVVVANGYYDLATPFFATEYTMDHLGLAPAHRGNISLKYYDAGHMMYIREVDHRRLRADLAEFYRATIGN
jgi:carboxypeptidase C (cathepsin A)